MTLFTIIVPVYNVRPYIGKCLESVVRQACPDFECICVDDGSSDGSGSILDDYAKQDARIKVIHQENGGVSAARNAALDVASGCWVQFLDGDDSLASDFLEKVTHAIESHPDVDAIEHTAIYCQNDGRKVYGCNGILPPAGVFDAAEIRNDPYGRKFTVLGRCACYKLFRRQIIEENHLRFTKGIPIGEDALFAGQFYAFASKIAICPDLAGYLRISREGSALNTISAEKLLPQIRADEELYKTWKRHPSKNFDRWVSASIASRATLGKNYGVDVRAKCITALLDSRFYRTDAMWFLLAHGTWKAKVFALSMLLSPRKVRAKILKRM